MRKAFIETLVQLCEQDTRIWLLTGDLGYSVLEGFAARFPERYVNVGVAEQNMAGIAAGLSLSGKIVFIYSIANFPTLRSLEQIRNDICYHAQNVKIVSVGGGMAYGPAGYTHHAIEDLAIMRSLPNMTIVAPGDPVETRLATRSIVNWDGPCYLRLGKSSEPVVHPSDPELRIGKAILVQAGQDVTLISTGSMLKPVWDAAELLQQKGISARVLSLHTIRPLDDDAIMHAATETQGIVCVEEHRSPGVVFSSVAALLVRRRIQCQVASFDLGESLVEGAYSQSGYHDLLGLKPEVIAERATSLVHRN